MVCHWSLSDRKSPQISRTLLGILADFNNAVVWMVTNSPLISNSSCPGINLLVTVPKALIIIAITVTFMFHGFFSIPKQGSGTYLSFRFLSTFFMVSQFSFFSSLLLGLVILLLFARIQSTKISRTRAIILANFNSTVLLIVLTLFLISSVTSVF